MPSRGEPAIQMDRLLQPLGNDVCCRERSDERARDDAIDRNLGEALRRRLGLSDSSGIELDIRLPLIPAFPVLVRFAVPEEVEWMSGNHMQIRSGNRQSLNPSSAPE